MADFISFFRKSSKHLDADKPTNTKKNAKKQIDTATQLINEYRAHYAHIDLNVLRNLIELKDITRQPKTDKPDKALKHINKRLGEAEAGETLRQERWGKVLHCPFCQSEKIQRLNLEQQKSEFIYRYQCLSCNEMFNDDSATAMEDGVPPIHTWMLCWYLYGISTSLQYIASKLGLDVATVELMIQYMQKLFNSNQPLSNFLSFDEWSQKYGSEQKLQAQSVEKKKLLFTGETSKAPVDTAEYRRQKNKFTPKLKPPS